MSANTSYVTTRQSLVLADSFIRTIANSYSYMFFGNHVPTNDDVADICPCPKDDDHDPRRNMIAGKLIQPDDLNLMIRNIPYESNKAFDMWDDQDKDIQTKDFFVIVDDNAYYHVYKCLDNNFGANSTVQPDFSHIIGANTVLYQTSDGYRWKYMFSVDEATADKFKSTSFFPLTANTEVEAQAVKGAIDIIKVEVAGRKYDNYLEGTFSTGDLSVNGNNHLFMVANSVASDVNGFYTGCLLYISSGTGAGEYRGIIDYIANANGNFIVIDTELTDVANDSRYQIYPRVVIRGSGSETIPCVARALVNSLASNSIFRVEILDPGKDYQYISANVTANDVVGVSQNASLRPIYSPLLGHGYSAAEELYANVVCVHTKFQNTESNTVIWENGFQQIGIIKDPLFGNVQINTANSSSAFLVGERVWKIKPIRIGFASMNTSSQSLVFSNADFAHSLVTANEYLWLTDSSNTESQFVRINGIVNSTAFELSSNGKFESADVFVYLANPSTYGYHDIQIDDTNFMLSNVFGGFAISDLIVGETTGTITSVNAISRNDVFKSFNTFMALHKYKGVSLGGEFQENETVYHTYSNGFVAYASLHSVLVNGPNIEIYCSNQIGVFETGANGALYGANSSASASLTQTYAPEIVFGTGDILYLENLEKIERANNQNETIQIYLEF